MSPFCHQLLPRRPWNVEYPGEAFVQIELGAHHFLMNRSGKDWATLIRNQQVSGSNPLVGSSEMPVLYEVGLFRVSVTGDARRVMGALLGATCRR